MTEFKEYAQQCSRFVKESSLQVARDQWREVRHLASSAEDKQQAAREIAGRDRIRDGLIGVLTATEPCISFPVRVSCSQTDPCCRAGTPAATRS